MSLLVRLGAERDARRMIAHQWRAYIAKAMLGLTTTSGLIERLTIDRALKRICGFAMWKKLPDEATFSRAFAEFATVGLAERAHEALVKDALGKVLVGHISRDGPAIESREKPVRREQTCRRRSVVVQSKAKYAKRS